MLINGQEGVLSIGGTSAKAVEMVERQTKDELDRVGALQRGETPLKDAPNVLKRSESIGHEASLRRSNWEADWRWSKVQGAEGWWQILMQGIWIDGSKILQNQAAVIDVTPTLFPYLPSETHRSN